MPLAGTGHGINGVGVRYSDPIDSLDLIDFAVSFAAMSESEYIVEATADNFAELVLARSRTVPVVVDFWAGWCAPCQMLMPVLHALAEEYRGKFILATVDTDREQQLALEYGVRSLPTVKLFKDGQVVDEFMGAQPPAAVRAFIDRHLEKPWDKLLTAALVALDGGQTDQARRLLEEVLEQDPANLQATLALARLQIRSGEAQQTQALLDALPLEHRENPEVKALAGLARFARAAQEAPDAAELERRLAEDPADLEARYRLGARKVLAEDYEGAMEEFLETMRRDRSFQDDLGRRSLLAVFEILGDRGELVNRYRRRMASLLY